MRILVTGATGLLGPYLMDRAAGHGSATGLARTGAEMTCDLSDAAAVRRVIGKTQPDCVLHAAAFTHVDRCEDSPHEAYAANAVATEHLASALPPSAVLVYFSTDQVYGDEPGLKREGAEQPVNIYGRSKLAGEIAARSHPGALILRCNMFGPSRSPGRRSFSDWIVDSLRQRQPVTFFTDVLFSPLHFATLAQLTLEAVKRGLRGTYNVGSREGRSKRDFAHMIARHLGLPSDAARDGISTQVSGRARRPVDLRLDVSRLEAALGRAMPTLQEEVLRL